MSHAKTNFWRIGICYIWGRKDKTIVKLIKQDPRHAHAHTAFMHCSHFMSATVTNTLNQSKVRDKWFVSFHNSRSQSITEKSRGRPSRQVCLLVCGALPLTKELTHSQRSLAVTLEHAQDNAHLNFLYSSEPLAYGKVLPTMVGPSHFN